MCGQTLSTAEYSVLQHVTDLDPVPVGDVLQGDGRLFLLEHEAVDGRGGAAGRGDADGDQPQRRLACTIQNKGTASASRPRCTKWLMSSLCKVSQVGGTFESRVEGDSAHDDNDDGSNSIRPPRLRPRAA